MSDTFHTVPASRGDLVTVTKYRRIMVVGGESFDQELTDICVVSAVRDGHMTAFRLCDMEVPEKVSQVSGSPIYHVFPKATTDVEGALAMARAQVWPSGATYPARPFESLDEALAALQPFLNIKGD